MTAPIYISTNSVRGFLFSPYHQNLLFHIPLVSIMLSKACKLLQYDWGKPPHTIIVEK